VGAGRALRLASAAVADAATIERAREILRGAPLIDGHNDLLWQLRKHARYDLSAMDPADPQPTLMTDVPRLRQGAVGGQFWSVYVSSDLPGDTAVTATLEQIDALYALIDRHPDTFELATTADDVERIAADGRVASLIGMEGGHCIGSSLGALRAMHALGARYMTLTHFNNTPWADSATDDLVHGGLSRFGEEVVREMNRLGMLVDLSHVSADTMRHAMRVGEAPPFFSHSSARALSDVTRNVPDDVLEEVGRANGVVMVTFVPTFVVAEGAEAMRNYLAELKRLEAEHPGDTDAVEAGMDAYQAAHPEPKATVADVADHIDHVRDVAGMDCIGVGSDFDGTSGMPEGLTDVSCYPNLFAELLDRGYSDEDCAKIAGRNTLRVMRETAAVGERLRAERGPSVATIDQLDRPAS
jgi:membrane dipeptidase